jgi:hypothetical protein
MTPVGAQPPPPVPWPGRAAAPWVLPADHVPGSARSHVLSTRDTGAPAIEPAPTAAGGGTAPVEAAAAVEFVPA